MGIETARYAKYTNLHQDQIVALQFGLEYSLSELTNIARRYGFPQLITTIKPGALPQYLPLYHPHLNRGELKGLLGLCEAYPGQSEIMLAKYAGPTPYVVTECVIADQTDPTLLEQYTRVRRRKCPTVLLPTLREAEEILGLRMRDSMRHRSLWIPTANGDSQRARVSYFDLITRTTAIVPLNETCWAHFTLSKMGALDRGSS